MTGPVPDFSDTDRLMREAATEVKLPNGESRWWFSHPGIVHTYESALAITEACRLLGVKVTDMLASATWLRMADKIIHLEEQVAAMRGEIEHLRKCR